MRREADPLRRGRMATELLAVYQQRAIELARLRREALDRLRADRGLSFSAVAAEFGLSKARVGQISQAGPPPERGFFGVGPITVAVPLRASGQRQLPVIASEDALSADRLTDLLQHLLFQVERFRIPTDGRWEPQGDVVAICGPKSSAVTARALEADPLLDFRQDEQGRWVIRDKQTGEVYRSPLDQDQDSASDIAYVGRLPIDGETMLVIAGVHALGSVGAVDYVSRHITELYPEVGSDRFSMVTRSVHDGESVTESEALCPARRHH